MVANPIRQFREARSRRWPVVDAEVDSCSWVEGHDNLGGSVGHYDVTFTYKVDDSDKVHRGHFCYPGSPQVVPYRWQEKIPIQYNPKKPSTYSYSGDSSSFEKIEAILVMTLFALIAGYLLYAI